MKLFLVYHNCRFTGVAILGLYLGEKTAIKVAMRKVYQLMNVHTKKIDKEWTWVDEHSFISLMEVQVADAFDLTSDSPLPQFFRYKDLLEETPIEDLERFRLQALNRKKILENVMKLKRN